MAHKYHIVQSYGGPIRITTAPPFQQVVPPPRAVEAPKRDLKFAHLSLAMLETEDDPSVRFWYRPFLLAPGGAAEAEDWVKELELATVMEMAKKDLGKTGERPKVLVLYGSLRHRYVTVTFLWSFYILAFWCCCFWLSQFTCPVILLAICIKSTDCNCLQLSLLLTLIDLDELWLNIITRSFSRLLAYEVCRILWRLGCDVRVFDPEGLPMKDERKHNHPLVQELRSLSLWSDGHFWVSPEQHGNLAAVFKNQIDWIPLSTGSVRPTQGRTLGIAMVSGGSQSFNTVNNLRILGRWMRMFTIPNQSSVPQAYTLFTEEGWRMRKMNQVCRG